MAIIAHFADGTSIGQREEQQDYKANLVMADGWMLYVLADGLGGQIGGAIASKTLANGFLAYFEAQGLGDSPEQSLQQALGAANNGLTTILREQPEMNGMGSTVIAVLYQQPTNCYHYLSVGDSPLYCLRADGLARINANHAYYEDLLEAVKRNEISLNEAEQHPNRHAITSAVMGKKISLIDTGAGQLQAGQLLVLASDGVQTLTDSADGELAAQLRANPIPEHAVTAILAAVSAKKDPDQDNTTLIIVEFVGETPAQGPVTQRIVPATVQVSRKLLLSTVSVTLAVVLALLFVLLSGGNTEPSDNPEPVASQPVQNSQQPTDATDNGESTTELDDDTQALNVDETTPEPEPNVSQPAQNSEQPVDATDDGASATEPNGTHELDVNEVSAELNVNETSPEPSTSQPAQNSEQPADNENPTVPDNVQEDDLQEGVQEDDLQEGVQEAPSRPNNNTLSATINNPVAVS